MLTLHIDLNFVITLTSETVQLPRYSATARPEMGRVPQLHVADERRDDMGKRDDQARRPGA